MESGGKRRSGTGRTICKFREEEREGKVVQESERLVVQPFARWLHSSNYKMASSPGRLTWDVHFGSITKWRTSV